MGSFSRRERRTLASLVTTTFVLAVLAAALSLGGCGSGTATTTSQTNSAPTGTSAQSLDEYLSQAAATASESPLSASWSSAELKSSSLTKEFESPSKYTCAIKVTVWKPVPKTVDSPVDHPADSEAVITPGSDYDPTTDTVIPFALTLTNTTRGFDLEKVGIRYRLTSQEAEFDTATEARTLEAWAWNSEGVDVTTWDLRGSKVSLENGLEDTWPSVEWSEPLATGDSVTNYGYFIYRDHRTPAEPHGTKSVLGSVIVVPTYTGGSAAGPRATKGLSLTGKVEETGLVW